MWRARPANQSRTTGAHPRARSIACAIPPFRAAPAGCRTCSSARPVRRPRPAHPAEFAADFFPAVCPLADQSLHHLVRELLKIHISSQLPRCEKSFLLTYQTYAARRIFFRALHLGELLIFIIS